MLVSSDVHAIFGDATCVARLRNLPAAGAEPGLPETFVYGGNHAPTGSNC